MSNKTLLELTKLLLKYYKNKLEIDEQLIREIIKIVTVNEGLEDYLQAVNFINENAEYIEYDSLTKTLIIDIEGIKEDINNELEELNLFLSNI